MKLPDAPGFLSAEEITAELRRYTYRPGWRLDVFVDVWEGVCLYVRVPVVNAHDFAADKLELRIRSLIPPMRDVCALGEWLLWRLVQVEIHEAREFLRCDGELVSDPHDPIEPERRGGNAREPDRTTPGTAAE